MLIGEPGWPSHQEMIKFIFVYMPDEQGAVSPRDEN